jgi:hypothetical protein
VLWADNFYLPDSVLWADFAWGEGVIWADFLDGVIWADFFDSVVWADIMTTDSNSCIEGD